MAQEIRDKLDLLRPTFEKHGQSHVFKFVDHLNAVQLEALYEDLSTIDLKLMHDVYNSLSHKKETNKSDRQVKPFPNVFTLKDTKDKRAQWEASGFEALANGKVGVLLLAGGQGTRLGSDPNKPKGVFDVGTPSHRTLYQYQGERLLKLIDLVKQKSGKKEVHVPWYIMTSDATGGPSQQYFEQHNYFGLPKEDIIFFNQWMIPCLTPDGKIIMESKYKTAKAPNGNGGLYSALKTSGALSDMHKRNLKFIVQYCVDNILVKMADPIFVGCCLSNDADVGVKVTPKLTPQEPVGVLAMLDGKPGVIEYSEIDKSLAEERDSHGTLKFNASHLCMNGFSVDFLEKMANDQKNLPYHVANKKIPSVNDHGETITPTSNNGWKLELFIFDVFSFSHRMVALEINRHEEFSPLKNAAGNDSPDTCKKHLSQLHKEWIENAGGHVSGDGLIEIDPSVSLNGEHLEDLVKGKTFHVPVHITSKQHHENGHKKQKTH